MTQCWKWLRNTTNELHFVLVSYVCLFRMVYPYFVLASPTALNQATVICFDLEYDAEVDYLHFVLAS